MDDDEPTKEPLYSMPASKMSKTPSWIMLGFILGAAFVAALPPWRNPPPPEPAPIPALEAVKPVGPREPPQLTTIEALFAAGLSQAVWFEDTTEVAAWNIQDRAFSDFYEVRRIGDAYFFRTIPKLTRRIITHGKPRPESPLQFTETEDQYREWLEHGRTERPASIDLRPRTQSAPEVRPIDRTAPAQVPPPEERIIPRIEIPKTPSGSGK